MAVEQQVNKLHNQPRMSDEIYHDMLSPEDVQDIRLEVRAFGSEHVAPVAREIAERDESVEAFPRALFDEMASAGLFRIPFAAEDGGRGLDNRVTATAVTVEELAYYSNSVAAIYDVHCILAGRTLERGSAEIREKYLGTIVDGSKVGAFATTEPQASSDLSPRAMETIAERTDAGYVVNGQKRWITNSPVAGFITVLCATPDGKMVELIVDTDQAGVRIGDPDRKLGNRGQLTADVYFENVEVPEWNRIGGDRDGLRIALSTLTYGRIGIAATGVGMAQAAFDAAMQHLKTRTAFGKRLGEFQHWQFKMAERATEIENARNLYLKASLRMDQGIDFPEPESAMAKFYATELAVDMARDPIQIMGGYGYMRELKHDGFVSPVEAIYRDAKIAEIYEGTNEIQRMIVARSLFGKEMVG
ncbi:acyl-CoA dehydrogenase family protein [Hoeflea sp.]|uniref:acyl-CoA dehydrogenase family protein n=1 Tax=Hoeflea sp. TaxID=1940281 RepID=UPI003B028EB5